LLHIDVKKLGRIAGRVGHRIHGDRSARVEGAGWEYVHVCIDDRSRLAYVEVLPDERQRTAAGNLERAVAFYRRLDIRVRAVMSDNGSAYRSRVFAVACQALSLHHLRTRPYRPRTNGKAERFIQTLLREWAYARPYRHSWQRTKALRSYVRYYNHRRPHGALDGKPPVSRLSQRCEQRVRAVATPSHIFLRYDDGVTRINIETFQEGASLTDDQYARDEKIPPESIRRGIFLRNLSDEEFLAQVHNNLGVIESGKKRYAQAAARYELALQLYPRFPAALYNYGTDLLHEGRAAEAARLLSKSLRLYPADPWALNNRGLAYLQAGKPQKALRDFEAALKLDPEQESAKRNFDALTGDRNNR